MTNTETTTIDKAAAVTPQGAHVAPEKAPAKKAVSQKMGAPQAKKSANGTKPEAKAKATPKKAAKTGRNASKKAVSGVRSQNGWHGLRWIFSVIGNVQGRTQGHRSARRK
jgi:hypothetical protein